MTYNLPTISSMRRQAVVAPMRRRPPRYESDADAGCGHRGRRFAGGRCAVCYRQSIQNYGRLVRRRGLNQPRRPPPRRPAPPPPLRLPRIPHVVRPVTPRSVPLSVLVLPGTRVYGSAGDFCVICMSSYENDRVCQQLPCNHRFHTKCFSKWYLKKRNCPMCRECC